MYVFYFLSNLDPLALYLLVIKMESVILFLEGTGFPIRTSFPERGEGKGNTLSWRWKMENLSKRVLVVDDDQGILDSFEVLLGDQYDLLKAGERF